MACSGSCQYPDVHLCCLCWNTYRNNVSSVWQNGVKLQDMPLLSCASVRKEFKAKMQQNSVRLYGLQTFSFTWFGIHHGRSYLSCKSKRKMKMKYAPLPYKKRIKNPKFRLKVKKKKRKLMWVTIKYWATDLVIISFIHLSIVKTTWRNMSSSLIKLALTTRNIQGRVTVIEHAHLSSSWHRLLSFRVEWSSLCNISRHLLSESRVRVPHCAILQQLLLTNITQSKKKECLQIQYQALLLMHCDA